MGAELDKDVRTNRFDKPKRCREMTRPSAGLDDARRFPEELVAYFQRADHLSKTQLRV